MIHLFHDSRDARYRLPFGALPCGARARLRVRADGVTPPEAVALRVWRQWEHRIPMTLVEDPDEDGWYYEATLDAGDVPGLVWYRFEADIEGRRVYYGNAADHLGGVGLQGTQDSYQITVYDPAFDPPQWLREGVMYQIMVDRFCNGDPTGALFAARKDVRRHADWYEPPTLCLAENGDNVADDFFGGNLAGIRGKLGYLASLGVTVLYLNPIFEARSNHKYDTGDYEHIDPMFGDAEAFAALCADAAALGIRLMLDGVFSHVGEDSRYFNRLGRYPDVGAYQSQDSPYAHWFTFERYPDEYASWWGFSTLPEVREEEPSYVAYMLTGPRAVVPEWLRRGASAWRLDVADELPIPFLRELRRQAKAAKADAAVLGEVWEDASNKVAYGELRCYALGDSLDSAMNYPLREALIGFLIGEFGAPEVKRRIDALMENYPTPFFYSLMNLLGSHDRARILNVLAGCDGEALPHAERGAIRLTPAQRALGTARVRLMLRLITALPGMPCVYYGDEAGMEGAADPFCRAAYPWGREDSEQVAAFRGMLTERRAEPVLTRGACTLFAACEDVLAVVRRIDGGRDAFGVPAENAVAVCFVNRSAGPRAMRLPAAVVGRVALMDADGRRVRAENGSFGIRLAPLESVLLRSL
jgi:4-alpha-glucanotransferase